MQPATLRAILQYLFQRLTKYEVIGAENVPAQGAIILATNHMSRLDTPLLMIATPRIDLIALVADKYKTTPLFYFIVTTTHSIWIDRSRADLEAFRGAKDFLKKGGVLGIAPEGTRSTVAALIPGKPGTAYLAEMGRCPVVPVAITGTEDAMKKIRGFRRPVLRVHYGKPFSLPPLDRRDRDASLQRNTDEVMCRIALMLPPAYRGVYADHPRLRELESTPEAVF